MEKKMREYRLWVERFLEANQLCEGCIRRGLEFSKATQVHHHRGRRGKLLMDRLYWLPICSDCHQWVHNNITAARKLRLIAEAGDWNKTK